MARRKSRETERRWREIEPLFVPLALLEAAPKLKFIHPRGCRARVTGEVSGAALRRVIEALDERGAR